MRIERFLCLADNNFKMYTIVVRMDYNFAAQKYFATEAPAHELLQNETEKKTKKKPNKTLVHDKHILTKQSFTHSSTNEPKVDVFDFGVSVCACVYFQFLILIRSLCAVTCMCVRISNARAFVY